MNFYVQVNIEGFHVNIEVFLLGTHKNIFTHKYRDILGGNIEVFSRRNIDVFLHVNIEVPIFTFFTCKFRCIFPTTSLALELN